ncbi:MAG: hypothetical protein HQL48_06310 [Gammaproteobacteria bacterium]|nr:hypothetical protein [Gammaproteobacteria bacterium]
MAAEASTLTDETLDVPEIDSEVDLPQSEEVPLADQQSKPLTASTNGSDDESESEHSAPPMNRAVKKPTPTTTPVERITLPPQVTSDFNLATSEEESDEDSPPEVIKNLQPLPLEQQQKLPVRQQISNIATIELSSVQSMFQPGQSGLTTTSSGDKGEMTLTFWGALLLLGSLLLLFAVVQWLRLRFRSQ